MSCDHILFEEWGIHQVFIPGQEKEELINICQKCGEVFIREIECQTCKDKKIVFTKGPGNPISVCPDCVENPETVYIDMTRNAVRCKECGQILEPGSGHYCSGDPVKNPNVSWVGRRVT